MVFIQEEFLIIIIIIMSRDSFFFNSLKQSIGSREQGNTFFVQFNSSVEKMFQAYAKMSSFNHRGLLRKPQGKWLKQMIHYWV